MNNISICIITKNEANNLKICLERLSKYDYEIVVIDTGSTDDSKEVATSYTDKVFDFVWCDDFAAARNFAISKASNEFIFMLDTDEFVDEIDVSELEKLIKDNPQAVGRMHRKNLYQSDGSDMASNELVNRLFPKSLYHYEGIIHEQIVLLEEKNNSYDTYVVPIYTTHVGYSGNSESRAEKAARNLKLLLIELEKNPDDTYILYQVAKAHFYDQGYNEAIPYLERTLELPLDTNLSYVHSIITTYGYCLINTKRYAEAMMLEAVYEDFKADADYLFVMGLIYMYNAQFNKAIENFLLATTLPSCTVEGVNSFSAYHNVGVILECLGDKTNAITYYKKCGSYAPALEGIERCSK